MKSIKYIYIQFILFSFFMVSNLFGSIDPSKVEFQKLNFGELLGERNYYEIDYVYENTIGSDIKEQLSNDIGQSGDFNVSPREDLTGDKRLIIRFKVDRKGNNGTAEGIGILKIEKEKVEELLNPKIFLTPQFVTNSIFNIIPFIPDEFENTFTRDLEKGTADLRVARLFNPGGSPGHLTYDAKITFAEDENKIVVNNLLTQINEKEKLNVNKLTFSFKISVPRLEGRFVFEKSDENFVYVTVRQKLEFKIEGTNLRSKAVLKVADTLGIVDQVIDDVVGKAKMELAYFIYLLESEELVKKLIN